VDIKYAGFKIAEGHADVGAGWLRGRGNRTYLTGRTGGQEKTKAIYQEPPEYGIAKRDGILYNKRFENR